MARFKSTFSIAELLHIYTDSLSAESKEKVSIINDMVTLGSTYDPTWKLTTVQFDNLYDDSLANLYKRFDNFDQVLTRLISMQAELEKQDV